MSWPLSQDYNEAMQTPAACFSDSCLSRGQARTGPLGLPIPCSGNFADVYQVRTADRAWAVKCFTREIPKLRERYAEISAYLHKVRLPFMVGFKYLDRGIRVRGQWYPVLKMDWVEGCTLNEFVKRNVERPRVLEKLARLWVRMARRLREANLAHCDLQHGNVLLVPGSRADSLAIKLVDYDGMFVPALAGTPPGEVGHPAYQHPQRLREATYSREVDRFPLLVIYCALRALMIKGRALWNRYDNGDNLLFRAEDLRSPRSSGLFAELRHLNDSGLQCLVHFLGQAAYQPLELTPLLDILVSEAVTSSPVRGPTLPPSQPVDQRRPATPPLPLPPVEAAETGTRISRETSREWRAPAGDDSPFTNLVDSDDEELAASVLLPWWKRPGVVAVVVASASLALILAAVIAWESVSTRGNRPQAKPTKTPPSAGSTGSVPDDKDFRPPVNDKDLTSWGKADERPGELGDDNGILDGPIADNPNLNQSAATSRNQPETFPLPRANPLCSSFRKTASRKAGQWSRRATCPRRCQAFTGG
jgi:hypothetical protein